MKEKIIFGSALALLVGAQLVFFISGAWAQQAWPNRPIKLIVPFPAGGNADSIGRLLGEKISEPLGQPIVVENRAGAGGSVGAHVVARSPADGYTWLIAPAAVMAVSHHLRKVPFDPDNDFTPIARLSSGYFIVAARKELPANTWPEMIALAKKEPGKLTFGSAGIATVTHLSGEIAHHRAGINLLHVPYKGSAEALSDLIGGRIDLMYDPVSLPQIKAGNAKALAVLSDARHPELPNVPTLKEHGLDFQAGTWFGLATPRGTPPEIVKRIAAEAQKGLAAPGVKERMVQFSQYPDFMGPEEFAGKIREESAFFKDLIKKLNIKIQ